MRHKTPKLKKLDMKKSEDHTHPDIRTDGTRYLCKIGGQYFTGRFSRVWFGLNFDGWHNPVGLQFDRPGYNSSDWQQIWEISK